MIIAKAHSIKNFKRIEINSKIESTKLALDLFLAKKYRIVN